MTIPTLQSARPVASSLVEAHLAAITTLNTTKSMLQELYPELRSIDLNTAGVIRAEFLLYTDHAYDNAQLHITSLLDALKASSKVGDRIETHFSIDGEGLAARGRIRCDDEVYSVRLYDGIEDNTEFLSSTTASFNKAVEILLRHA